MRHVEDDGQIETEVIVISDSDDLDSDDLLSDVAPVTATTFSSDDSSSESEDLVQRCMSLKVFRVSGWEENIACVTGIL